MNTQRSDVLFAIRNVSKEFSKVRVLNSVSINLRRGEILGLIGENGAGKSTLMKIISGIYQPTSGTLVYDGKEVDIPDYITAKSLGISIVPQEFNLINTLKVYENIFLGNEMRGPHGLLSKKMMRDEARRQLSRLRTKLDVDALVSDLSVAQKQMVEISKALLLNARILIMDEPTTTLTGYEVSVLFNVMKELRRQGVSILFISHKLKEVKSICDRVAILRDGELISVEIVDLIDEAEMARKMIGRDFTQVFPPKRDTDETDEVLRVDHLKLAGLSTANSFRLNRGEILGFAGLVGSGRTELFEALMGLRPGDSGEIYIKGKKVVIRSPQEAVNYKLGYISEDRQGKGIVSDFTISQNITLIALARYVSHLLINKRAEIEKSEEYVKAFNIIAASPKMALRFFSGGNQQKVYLARWVETEPEILIFDEPTRGIDVNAKKEIYEFIHHLCDNGISCIIISSEMEEIIGLCSRVYVMREGKIQGVLKGKQIDEEHIMFLATGIKGRIEDEQ
ncbi:MAG: sugar ABC transporter ATP-binding protein [Sphaerochaetaceae bacterium]